LDFLEDQKDVNLPPTEVRKSMQPSVIILSLKDADERRAALIDALNDHGVSYEIWDAIDGRGGLAPQYEAMVDRPAARKHLCREMGNAEFACALSHHFIYRAVLERGLDMAVVLEDDAIVDQRFFNFLDAVQPPACDLLLLDHMRTLVHRRGKLMFECGTSAYRCKSIPWLTTGYLVTRTGAQKLVNQSLPISAPADWPIDITQMTTYAMSPRIVDHPDMHTGASDIRQDRSDDLLDPQHRKPRRLRRLLSTSYWRKTYHKRLGKWIS
jgi:glycosyl transferase family 25